MLVAGKMSCNRSTKLSIHKQAAFINAGNLFRTVFLNSYYVFI